MNIYTKIELYKRAKYVDVYIYYSRYGKRFRGATDVRVSPKHITSTGAISASHPNYHEDLKKIGLVQARVEELIADYYEEYGIKPAVNWLEAAFAKSGTLGTIPLSPVSHLQAHLPSAPPPTSPAAARVPVVPALEHTTHAQRFPHASIPIPASTPAPTPPPAASLNGAVQQPNTEGHDPELLSFWKEFIAEKEEVSRNNKGINRINAARHTLRAFIAKRETVYAFENLSQKFFNDLVHYMVKEHVHYRSRRADQIPTGMLPIIGLANDSAIKRIKDFRDYLNYCRVMKDVPISIDKIDHYIKVSKKKYSVRPLKQKQRWELWLTADELQYVVNLEHHEPQYWKTLSDNQRRYLDIFIFMCLQGMAPIDAKGIGFYDIVNHQITKDRSKCFTEFDVKLDPIAEEILKRYGYDLTFTEQAMNEEIKRLFVTIFEFYRVYYEAQTGRPYQIICAQKHYIGEELTVKVAHRGLFVENMTGRRTYINIREQQVGIKGTMPEVGQTKASTTEGYIYDAQQFRDPRSTLGIQKISRPAPFRQMA